MLTKIMLALVSVTALNNIGCASAPKLDRISANYLSCSSDQLKPVEVTDHGWYHSWYVNCEGRQYFCRYNSSNLNGWNGCRTSSVN